MNGSETLQNGESPSVKVLPIFYKKKVFSLETTRDLEEKKQESLDNTNKIVENEKAMLDKIRDRHNEFVNRLEYYLEQFQSKNAVEIVLVEDMFPQWSPQKKETESKTASSTSNPIDEDAIERLNEWYATMVTYVTEVGEKAVEGTIKDWFTHLDRIKNEGEKDPTVLEYTTIKWKDSLADVVDPLNVLYYFIFILLCVVNVFIFYQPEDVKKCADEPGQCIMNSIIYFLAKISNSYLAFHNMTIHNMPVTTAALNSSIK